MYEAQGAIGLLVVQRLARAGNPRHLQLGCREAFSDAAEGFGGRDDPVAHGGTVCMIGSSADEAFTVVAAEVAVPGNRQVYPGMLHVRLLGQAGMKLPQCRGLVCVGYIVLPHRLTEPEFDATRASLQTLEEMGSMVTSGLRASFSQA